MTGFVVQGSKLLQAHKENWLTGEIQKADIYQKCSTVQSHELGK